MGFQGFGALRVKGLWLVPAPTLVSGALFSFSLYDYGSLGVAEPYTLNLNMLEIDNNPDSKTLQAWA